MSVCEMCRVYLYIFCICRCLNARIDGVSLQSNNAVLSASSGLSHPPLSLYHSLSLSLSLAI